MAGCVIVREDDPDVADLVRELLEESDYSVVVVVTVEELLREARLRSPCVALVDGSDPASFDLWWLGSELNKLGVPGVAFTAHASAVEEFKHDPHDFVGIIGKPFDTDEFLAVVNTICWEDHQQAAS
jgi:DNA-binding response OmpR family regulator